MGVVYQAIHPPALVALVEAEAVRNVTIGDLGALADVAEIVDFGRVVYLVPDRLESGQTSHTSRISLHSGCRCLHRQIHGHFLNRAI